MILFRNLTVHSFFYTSAEDFSDHLQECVKLYMISYLNFTWSRLSLKYVVSFCEVIFTFYPCYRIFCVLNLDTQGGLAVQPSQGISPGRHWPRSNNNTGLVKAGFTGPEAAIPTWSSRCPDLFRPPLYNYIKWFCPLSSPTTLASSWIT